jgi:hypothetical protein
MEAKNIQTEHFVGEVTKDEDVFGSNLHGKRGWIFTKKI